MRSFLLSVWDNSCQLCLCSTLTFVIFFDKNLTAKMNTPVPVLLYIKLIKPMSSIRPLQGVLRLAPTPRWCWGDPWGNRASRHLYLLSNYEPITQYLLYVGNPRQRLVFLPFYSLLVGKSEQKAITQKKRNDWAQEWLCVRHWTCILPKLKQHMHVHNVMTLKSFPEHW